MDSVYVNVKSFVILQPFIKTTRTSRGNCQWLRKASVHDITVSVQEDYRVCVGGGSPVLVLFAGTATGMTQLIYNDWLIFHSHLYLIQKPYWFSQSKNVEFSSSWYYHWVHFQLKANLNKQCDSKLEFSVVYCQPVSKCCLDVILYKVSSLFFFPLQCVSDFIFPSYTTSIC